MRKNLVRILMILALNSGMLLAVHAPRALAISQPAAAVSERANLGINGEGSVIYLPIVSYPPTITEILHCSYPNKAIPENGTVTDTLSLTETDYVTRAEIWVKVDHTYVGDVSVTLSHSTSGQEITLLDRPGYPETSTGCAYDNIYAIFSDRVSQPAENKCRSASQAISGMYLPVDPLAGINKETAAGDWTLRVSDAGEYDSGTLGGWCIFARLSNQIPSDPFVAPLPDLPASASVYGVTGQSQALPLDCESRSAIDWAAFFGKNINELTFFNKLPRSDNPNKGFVGDVYGTWGQVPPNDYGIHAEPVAALLRAYGLPAQADMGLRWDDIRAEIAANRPVIVWVEGYIRAGKPRFYLSPSDNGVSIVAPYEHTVIVVGYNQDYVAILNGSKVSSVPINSFLDAWATLGNMAIRYR